MTGDLRVRPIAGPHELDLVNRVHLRKEPHRPVRARQATADERAVLWPRLVDVYADFAKYATWTDREIPAVILAPRAPLIRRRIR